MNISIRFFIQSKSFQIKFFLFLLIFMLKHDEPFSDEKFSLSIVFTSFKSKKFFN